MAYFKFIIHFAQLICNFGKFTHIHLNKLQSLQLMLVLFKLLKSKMSYFKFILYCQLYRFKNNDNLTQILKNILKEQFSI